MEYVPIRPLHRHKPAAPMRLLGSAALAIVLPVQGVKAASSGSGTSLGWLGAPVDWLGSNMGLLAATAAVTAAVFYMRERTARHRTRRVEQALRENLRCRDSLHAAFVATEVMDRPTEELLADLADAIRSGFDRPDALRVRIRLSGTDHDEIGGIEPVQAISRTIPHIPAGTGEITVAYGESGDATLALRPFSQIEEETLSLIASRVGGRALGQQTQRELRRNEEAFRSIYGQQPVATLVIIDGLYVEANELAARMLGYDSPSDLIGKSPLDFSPPFQPDGQPSEAAAAAIFERMLSLEFCRFEWEHVRKDGQPVLVDVQSVSARDASGRTVIYIMGSDITVRRHAEEVLAAYQRTLEAQVALRTEELSRLYDELRAIVSTAGSGIALVRNGVIANANPALARMLLADEDKLSGRPVQDLFRDRAEAEMVLAQTDASFTRGRPFQLEQEFRREDGSSFWGRLRAAAVDDDDPSRGAVWVLDDVTPDRNARHELAHAREIAEQAVRLKSDFLAEMSHEIRSPINAVLGFTEMLLNTPMTGLQLDYLRKVQASGRHLLMIINDILDLSKVEAGKLRIESTEFDIGPALYSAVDSVTSIAADKDLELLVDIDPAVPDRFTGDPLRITQVLINLLSNAVKFTARGSVRLAVTGDLLAGGRAGLRFTVTDTGIGMTPEQVERLFQPFAQADTSTARLYGGTGLGLSICKQIVALMGGDIGLTSTKGAGSSFWFTVPLKPVAAPHARPAPPDRLAGLRALVIDDHDMARDLTVRPLLAAGMSVETAENGEDAVLRAREAQTAGQPFDVILIDRKMPGLSGIDCARRLRALPVAARLLLLSKRGGQDLIDLIDAEGMDGLVSKPVVPADLLQKIAEALDHDIAKPRAQKTAARKPAARKAASRSDARAGGPAGAAWSGCRALVVDDNDINRELAAAMLEKAGFAVDGAGNGAEALEAVLRKDFDVVLIDGQMPVMDGFEAARRIRALPTAKGKVPIIGLTGQGGDDDRDTGLRAGMNAYLVKPVRMAELNAALHQWLPRTGRPD